MQTAIIIDNNALFRRALQNILQLSFPAMYVVEADSGWLARLMVESLTPQVVFIDPQLPGENGFEIIENIKHRRPNIAIIVLTDYDPPQYRQAALAAGAGYFLAKSRSSAQDILSLVEQVVKKLPARAQCSIY